VAETTLFPASFGSNALTGQSVVVSHGWHMQQFHIDVEIKMTLWSF
jgi:hypothetical protein